MFPRPELLTGTETAFTELLKDGPGRAHSAEPYHEGIRNEKILENDLSTLGSSLILTFSLVIVLSSDESYFVTF